MALPNQGAAPSGFDPKRDGKAGVDQKLRARVEGKVLSTEEATELLKRLEAQAAQLRQKYDMFFLGLERAAPTREREGLKKAIDDLKLQCGRNTGLKFGAQSLFHRFQTYERMWARTEKEIEEGTYKRDIFKAKLHAQEKAQEKEPPKPDLDPDLTAGATLKKPPAIPASKATTIPTGRPPTSPPALGKGTPPPVPRAPSGPPIPGGPSEDKLRAVYQAYMSAKKQCKESTKGMTYEQVAGELRKQVPQILAGGKAKAVDFKVVIKDGKASLRAVPKE